MTTPELEKIIRDLVKRKWALDTSDAEIDFIDRMLLGLCYKHAAADEIWEGLDDAWHGANTL